MICPKCGQKVPEGKKFCGYCGTVLKPPSPEPPSQLTREQPESAVENRLEEVKARLTTKETKTPDAPDLRAETTHATGTDISPETPKSAKDKEAIKPGEKDLAVGESPKSRKSTSLILACF